MTWDYVETNVLSHSPGNVSSSIEWAHKALYMLSAVASGFGGKEMLKVKL